MINDLKTILFNKKELLNSSESLSFAYLLMTFSLISSRYEYLKCLNCGMNYKIIVSCLFFIVFGSYQILTINAYFNKQKKQIRLFNALFIPLIIYFPVSIYLFLNSAFDLLSNLLLIIF